jgi:hypothetical protein
MANLPEIEEQIVDKSPKKRKVAKSKTKANGFDSEEWV